MQAPGHPDEDRDGGFEHGGWHLRYFDDTSREWVVRGYAEAGGFLFGRRTYENLAAYWPHASEEEQVIAEPLNTKPKYVASGTLAELLEWQNSTVLTGDVAQAVVALKQQDGRDLHVIGSLQLAQTLVEHDLVDEYRLMIDPLIVGGGKRLFRGGTAPHPLRLVESKATSTGAILAKYATSEG
jgi:dihydrofolate reductase